ncbi:MAG: PAS domain S-box protein [Dehalococcoidia bacterium]
MAGNMGEIKTGKSTAKASGRSSRRSGPSSFQTMLDAALDSIPQLVMILDNDHRIKWANKSTTAFFKLPLSKITGKYCYALMHGSDTPPEGCPLTDLMKSGKQKEAELYLPGKRIRANVTAVPQFDNKGNIARIVHIVDDITERKMTERALRQSEAFLKSIIEHSPYAMWISDSHGLMIKMNKALRGLFNVTDEELVGKYNIFQDNIVEEQGYMPLVQDVFEKGVIAKFTLKYDSSQLKSVQLKKTRYVLLEVTISPIIRADGKITNAVIQHVDITERERAKQALSESEDRWQFAIEGSGDGLWDWNTGTNQIYFSPQFKALLGYKDNELSNSLAEWDKRLHPDDYDRVYTEIVNHLAGKTPEYVSEHRMLCKNGSYRWMMGRGKIITWTADGQPLRIVGTQTDITERKLAEENLLKSHTSLRKTLSDAINTMAKIVELRDPYTAGHQQNVADLATAISKKMKLEDTNIEHIRMASVIHDIGKMYIPTDILSKPGKLTYIEFELIKTHPQYGYDIVHGMEFPGVVAQAILQHHERLDGSGYPGKLKDYDIILEAKILAVADVIEAMASHRPYRSAMGIDKALEEISTNRGILYDPAVVDICMELFRTGSFAFKTA